jgi:branched-chain amino acid transport system permease protein
MTSRLSGLAPWLAFALILIAAPRVFPSATALTMMSLMGVMIIFALSYNMLLGQTGLLSFGHAVYYGLGGFVAIHAMNAVIHNKLGVSIPVIPLVGGLAGLAFGVLFGLISTRRAGLVFSMISLGIGELVSSSSFILRTFFGGEEGITTNRSKLAPFFGHKFGPQIEVYYLIAVWCFVCVLAMYALTLTPFGRMCNAVRENPERVEFVGYSPRMVRLIAFSFAALFAGIAGGLAAISFEIMNAQQLGAQQSSLVLLMAYIGGVGSFAGPIVGAVIITFLQITLSDVTSAWQLYFGLMFIAVVMFVPEGVVGWTMLHLRALRGGGAWRLAPAYAAVGPALAASGVGAIMIIELANRQLAEARSEGSAMRLFGFDVDASTLPPWIVAVALFAAGGFGRGSATPGAPSTRGCTFGARDERGAFAPRASEELRPRADHPRSLARHRRGRAARDHRAERRRQIDAVQSRQRPHPAELGRSAPAWAGDHRAFAV